MGTTPERIRELDEQAKRWAKLGGPPPSKTFAQVMGRWRNAPDAEGLDEPDEASRKREKLPRQGPRPAMVHPSQRDVFGRGDDEPLVLKG